MLPDGLRLVLALAADLGEPWLQACFVEVALDQRTVGHDRRVRRMRHAHRPGRSDLEEDRRLTQLHLARRVGLDHEEPTVERVAAAVLDRRGEDVQAAGLARWRS